MCGFYAYFYCQPAVKQSGLQMRTTAFSCYLALATPVKILLDQEVNTASVSSACSVERAGSPWITKFRSLADDTANAGWELLLLFLTTCKTHNKKCQKLCQRNFATLCCNTLLRINTPSVPRSDHNQSDMENSNRSAWKILTLKIFWPNILPQIHSLLDEEGSFHIIENSLKEEPFLLPNNK